MHDATRAEHISYAQLRRRELIAAERQAILALRNQGRVSGDVMRQIQRDLDLQEARLRA